MRRPKLLSCGAATSIDTAENQRRCSAALSHQRHHDLRFHRRLSTTAAPQRIERRKMVRSQYVKVPCDAPESRIHFAAFGSHSTNPGLITSFGKRTRKCISPRPQSRRRRKRRAGLSLRILKVALTIQLPFDTESHSGQSQFLFHTPIRSLNRSLAVDSYLSPVEARLTRRRLRLVLCEVSTRNWFWIVSIKVLIMGVIAN